MNIRDKKLAYFFLIFIPAFFGGCQGNQYNFSKKPIARSINAESNMYQLPYAVKYKDNNRELVFLTAGHENPIHQQRFTLTKMLIEDFRPKAIIVEGLIEHNASRQTYYDYLKKCGSNDFQYCGEAAYAASLVKENHNAIIGGEPHDEVIWNRLKNKGVSVQDFISICLLWQIPQWNREHKSPEDFEQYAQKQIQHYLLLTHAKIGFTYKNFREWYKMHTGKPFMVSSIRTDVFFKSGSSLLKKAAEEINQLREEFLSKKIAHALKRYSKVMVVYGENHYEAQKPVLEDLLGSPIRYITSNSEVNLETQED